MSVARRYAADTRSGPSAGERLQGRYAFWRRCRVGHDPCPERVGEASPVLGEFKGLLPADRIELRPDERVAARGCAVPGMAREETQPGQDAVDHAVIDDPPDLGFTRAASGCRGSWAQYVGSENSRAVLMEVC